MTFDEACRKIIAAGKRCEGGSLMSYAIAYAKAAIGMTGHEQGVQSLYILNNLQYWRGDEAKEVKAFLKTLDPYKKK